MEVPAPVDNPLDIKDSFDKWYDHYKGVVTEKDELAERLKAVLSENEMLTKTNVALNADIGNLHQMVQQFHQQVTEVDTLKDRNNALIEEVAQLKEKLAAKTKEYDVCVKELRTEYDEKLISLKNQCEAEATAEQLRLTKALEAKSMEISNTKKQVQDLEKEKEKELANLSLEYESKLVKIQRQKVQLLQTNQQTGNQDIFRKKLQHMKESYEEEIASLKKQVGHLEAKLVKVDATPYNGQTAARSFVTKKK